MKIYRGKIKLKQKTIKLSFMLMFLLFVSLSFTAVAQGFPYLGATWGTPCTVSNIYEKAAMSDACSNISSLINGRTGWTGYNYYDGSTTSDNVYYFSDTVRSSPYVSFLATFHVGDMYPEIRSGTRHYNYYDSSGDGNGIEDTDLYSHTGSKHYFTFIWTCANGDLFINPITSQLCYGYDDTQNYSGVVGMPYAWTKTTGMQNGYDNPSGSFTYISFENVSKALSDSSEFIYKNYGEFLKCFYHHAIVDHQSINAALDSAMDDMGTWRDSFDDSELYTGYNVWVNGIEYQCKMRVYGNGNMVLPY